MSVYKNEKGQLVIQCENIKGSFMPEDYHRITKSIIDLIQERSSEFSDPKTVIDALQLVKELLPNNEQCKLLFEHSQLNQAGEVVIGQGLRNINDAGANDSHLKAV